MDKFLDARTLIVDSGSASFVNQKNLFNLSQEMRKVAQEVQPKEKMQVLLPLVNLGTDVTVSADFPFAFLKGEWVVKEVTVTVSTSSNEDTVMGVTLGDTTLEMTIAGDAFSATYGVEFSLEDAYHTISVETVTVGVTPPKGLTLTILLEKP